MHLFQSITLVIIAFFYAWVIFGAKYTEDKIFIRIIATGLLWAFFYGILPNWFIQ